jgi:hypothetical protein
MTLPSLCTINLAALVGVTGGAKVVINGIEYGPGTYVNGVKVAPSGSGGSITIDQGSSNVIVITR